MANYIDNDEFLNEIIEYRKTGSKKYYNKIGEKFQLIARNFLNSPKFINYTVDRKAEMESDAVYFMLKYMKNYKTDRPNPFSYFTMIAYNSFLQNIKKYKIRSKMFTSLDFNENIEYNEDFYNNMSM